MSGIVGIVNLDGAPADRELLQRLTDFMVYRGPDAQQVWVDNRVGFGHTLLRTTIESQSEEQPYSLDGDVWIVADARVDGRNELIAKLQLLGCEIGETTPDPVLMLQAYRVWGKDCLNYLIGDFAFAIWDGRKQRLFCARDQFGVKPFYYARAGNCLVFSNTLNCIRQHPAVSNQLNDLAIADFLVFGSNQEADTTAFADIARLPAAHYLMIENYRGSLAPQRYWTLPIDGYIRYRQDEEYVEHFKELMRVAVGDRLRTDKVAIYMSGGMDSTAVAAFAKELGSQQFANFDLRAYSTVYDRLIPDRERYYSGLAAEKLGIPIHYQVADDFELYEGREQIELKTPEPTTIGLYKPCDLQDKQIVAHCRVALNGQGGDPVFYSWGAYFYVAYLLKNFKLGELVAQLSKYVRSHGRFPQPGVRSRVKKWLGIRPWRPSYPKWIDPELEKRLHLRERWEKLTRERPLVHPIRPEAYQQLTSKFWPELFEFSDPGVSGLPVEVRSPFFDLRLVNYLLAIPPIPWFMFKELARVAMRGILPEEVRLRPKTPLAGDPIGSLLQQPVVQWVDRFQPTPDLENYAIRDAIPQICGMGLASNEAWIDMRPLSLDQWLQNVNSFNSKSSQEEQYELV